MVTRTQLNFERSLSMHRRLLELVPGGSQTTSKRATRFALGQYPIFASHGRGGRVWDVDGNEYVDFVMALGPITLGYCYPAVDAAIQAQLARGIVYGLLAEVEVEAAEAVVAAVGDCVDEVTGAGVRQMAHPAHHALFHRPWVRSDLQHIQIVIGFQQQQVSASQVKLDGFRNVAQVGGYADAHALRFEAVADGVDGIMGDAETLHFDIADAEAGAGLERLQARGPSFAPLDSRGGEPRHINCGAEVPVARQHGQPRDVVGVFVRD